MGTPLWSSCLKSLGKPLPLPFIFMNANKHYLQLLYQQILGRPADSEGLTNYQQQLDNGTLNHAQVMQALIDSDEYQQKQPLIKDSVLEQLDDLNKDDYEQYWQAIFNSDKPLIIGQQQYGHQHKQRFFELFNAIVFLTKHQPSPKIIEFGISEFSALYKQLNPQTQLDTVDKPTAPDYLGFKASVCQKISQCLQHYEIDLNEPSSIKQQLKPHYYDVVVFTEILEHLVVNPIELLTELINLLSSTGVLYLTTPNFYNQKNRQLIKNRENPQHLYPGTTANWDAHYHHREYCYKELCQIIPQAGGEIRYFYYSDCWDDDKNLAKQQRGNLVFVIQPTGCKL